MKMIKTVLAMAAAAAFLGVMTIPAAEPLLSPRASGTRHPVVASGVKDADYAHSAAALGNAAKSKAAGPTVIAATGKTDPNLLACARLGKATCSMNPCDGTMVAACCKK